MPVLPTAVEAGKADAWHRRASRTASLRPTIRDWGRRYLPSWACIYIDSNHLEIGAAGIPTAADHTAGFYALLATVRRPGDPPTPVCRTATASRCCSTIATATATPLAVTSTCFLTRCAWNSIFYRKLAAAHVPGVLSGCVQHRRDGTGQGQIVENHIPPTT